LPSFFPELKHLIKWHLFDSNSPMHYVADTLYHAGETDHNGLVKGERRQIVNGRSQLPAWQLVAIDKDGKEVQLYELKGQVDSAEKPVCEYTIDFRPWCREGEGKARDLKAARESACWPEATDEQLCLPKEELKKLLEERLPSLMQQFRKGVEEAGFSWEYKG
jgi:hypothetical protein